MSLFKCNVPVSKCSEANRFLFDGIKTNGKELLFCIFEYLFMFILLTHIRTLSFTHKNIENKSKQIIPIPLGIFAIFLCIQPVLFSSSLFFVRCFWSHNILFRFRFFFFLFLAFSPALGKYLLRVIHETQCHLILDSIFTF